MTDGNVRVKDTEGTVRVEVRTYKTKEGPYEGKVGNGRTPLLEQPGDPTSGNQRGKGRILLNEKVGDRVHVW